MERFEWLVAATLVASVCVATSALAGATPSGKTNACLGVDGGLAAKSPATQAFHSLARQALKHGCVAYVATASPATLGLEFVRGPETGTTIIIGSTGVQLTDIALTSSGTLYGIDFDNFYRVDPDTGQSTLIGAVGAVVNGLVVGPTGTIYAAAREVDQLRTIDPTTGASTLVGNTGFLSAGDLAFAPDGTLYMTARRSTVALPSLLVGLDPATGAGTLVGSIGQQNVFGLVSSYGTFFGMTSGGQLLTIDLSTGAGTVVSTDGPSVFGASSLPDTA
jgi:hypothetical protein